MTCSLCDRPSDMLYAVDRDNPRPLCGKCFGMYAPAILDKLLGVTQNVLLLLPYSAIMGALIGGAL